MQSSFKNPLPSLEEAYRSAHNRTISVASERLMKYPDSNDDIDFGSIIITSNAISILQQVILCYCNLGVYPKSAVTQFEDNTSSIIKGEEGTERLKDEVINYVKASIQDNKPLQNKTFLWYLLSRLHRSFMEPYRLNTAVLTTSYDHFNTEELYFLTRLLDKVSTNLKQSGITGLKQSGITDIKKYAKFSHTSIEIVLNSNCGEHFQVNYNLIIQAFSNAIKCLSSSDYKGTRFNHLLFTDVSLDIIKSLDKISFLYGLDTADDKAVLAQGTIQDAILKDFKSGRPIHEIAGGSSKPIYTSTNSRYVDSAKWFLETCNVKDFHLKDMQNLKPIEAVIEIIDKPSKSKKSKVIQKGVDAKTVDEQYKEILDSAPSMIWERLKVVITDFYSNQELAKE